MYIYVHIYFTLQKRDLLKTFCIDPRVFVRYLLRVESTYHADVPYHNSMHAADVLQTAHFLLQAEALDVSRMNRLDL